MPLLVQMLAAVPEDKKPEARKYLQAVQDGLKKVQGAIDLKYVSFLESRSDSPNP